MADVKTDVKLEFLELEKIDKMYIIASYIASEFNSEIGMAHLIQRLREFGLAEHWYFMSDLDDIIFLDSYSSMRQLLRDFELVRYDDIYLVHNGVVFVSFKNLKNWDSSGKVDIKSEVYDLAAEILFNDDDEFNIAFRDKFFAEIAKWYTQQNNNSRKI